MLKGNGPFCPADPDDTMAIFKLISDCRIEFSRAARPRRFFFFGARAGRGTEAFRQPPPRRAGKEVAQFGEPLTTLTKQLLNRARKKRLGNLKGGIKNIKEHPYFASVNWVDILNRRIATPWSPEVTDPFDTSCFDEYDENMEIPAFPGEQAIFKDFAEGMVDDSHIIQTMDIQQSLAPTVH